MNDYANIDMVNGLGLRAGHWWSSETLCPIPYIWGALSFKYWLASPERDIALGLRAMDVPLN